MAYSLYIKNGNTWKIPRDVLVKINGNWYTCKYGGVWKKTSGVWHKHWPPPDQTLNFISYTQQYSIGQVSATTNIFNGGWSNWITLQIPGLATSTRLAHLNGVTMWINSVVGDDDYSDDGTGVGGTNTITLQGTYIQIQNPAGYLIMGNINTSSTVTQNIAQNSGTRLSTISVPTGQLLVGVQVRINAYREHNSLSGFEFRILTAGPSYGTITKSGSINTDQKTNTTGYSLAGYIGRSVGVYGLGYTATAFGIGYGYAIGSQGGGGPFDDASSGSHTDMAIQMNSQPTTWKWSFI